MTRRWFEIDDKVLDSHPLIVRIIDLATQRGANRDALLRGTGIFYQDIQRQNTPLTAQQVFRLLQNAQKLVSSQDLSFLLGRRLFPSNIGIATQLLSNARHLNDMLRMLQCFQAMLFPYLSINVQRHKQHTYLLINSSIANSEQQQFLVEALCAALHGACKWLFGQSLPLHYYFTCARPRNIYQYEENLGYRLHFSQPLTMISIENHWLTQTLPDSSPLIRKQQRQTLRAMRQAAQLSLTNTASCGLLQFVAQLLRCEQQRNPHLSLSLEDIAERMAISPATLKRKLKQHGSTFQKLQDSVKQQQAIVDLCIRQLSNKDTAERLGFTDLANFRRAFKRWTGKTPSDFKDAHTAF